MLWRSGEKILLSELMRPANGWQVPCRKMGHHVFKYRSQGTAFGCLNTSSAVNAQIDNDSSFSWSWPSFGYIVPWTEIFELNCTNKQSADSALFEHLRMKTDVCSLCPMRFQIFKLCMIYEDLELWTRPRAPWQHIPAVVCASIITSVGVTRYPPSITLFRMMIAEIIRSYQYEVTRLFVIWFNNGITHYCLIFSKQWRSPFSLWAVRGFLNWASEIQ